MVVVGYVDVISPLSTGTARRVLAFTLQDCGGIVSSHRFTFISRHLDNCGEPIPTKNALTSEAARKILVEHFMKTFDFNCLSLNYLATPDLSLLSDHVMNHDCLCFATYGAAHPCCQILAIT